MIVGFNHNILYQGVGFHVQTEDGGLKSPSLVTLLYHGGIIVTSQKTSYADILGVDNLNQVVEDLAKEQHKGMLRRLTKGEFDERILALGIKIEASASTGAVASAPTAQKPREAAPPIEEVALAPEAAAVEETLLLEDEIEALETVPLEPPLAEAQQPETAAATETFAEPRPLPEARPLRPAEELPPAIEPAFEPLSAEDRDGRQNVSEALDDLIFSYLTGGNEKG